MILGGLWGVELPRLGVASAPPIGTLGSERLRRVAPDLDPDLVRDVVSTAAFRMVNGDQDRQIFTWGHRSWAEFLAAKHLASKLAPPPPARSVTPGRLRSLFEHAEDPERQVAGPLQDTARWLAELSPVWMKELVGVDAVRALQVEGEIPLELRPALVNALLRGVASGRLVHQMPIIMDRVGRIGHAGLADQLRGPLSRRPLVPSAVEETRLALKLVRRNQVVEAAEWVVDLILDAELSEPLRQDAANVFDELKPAPARLVKTVRTGSSELPTGVRLWLLAYLWPSQITTRERLDALHPMAPIARALPPHQLQAELFAFASFLSGPELVCALLWVREVAAECTPSSGVAFAVGHFVRRAADLSGDSIVYEQLVALLAAEAGRLGVAQYATDFRLSLGDRRLGLLVGVARRRGDGRCVGPELGQKLTLTELTRLLELVAQSDGRDRAVLSGLVWGAWERDDDEQSQLVVNKLDLLRDLQEFEVFYAGLQTHHDTSQVQEQSRIAYGGLPVRTDVDHLRRDGQELLQTDQESHAKDIRRLLQHPSRALLRLGPALVVDEARCRSLLELLIERLGMYNWKAWLAEIQDEAALKVLLSLLVAAVPAIRTIDTHPRLLLGHDAVLHLLWRAAHGALAAMGTSSAIEALEALPSSRVASAALASAKDKQLAKAWHPPQIEAIADVLDQDRRHVGSDSQLLDLLVEMLGEIEEQDIRGKPGLLTSLWVEGKTKGSFVPRDENTLSDVLAVLLRLRAPQVLANREVQLTPRRGASAGERVDILWQAPSAEARVAAIIEVKGNWNPDLMEAPDEQIARYLTDHPGCSAALLLVGWYESSAWHPEDVRRRTAHPRTLSETKPKLEDACCRVGAAQNKDVRLAILDLSLPEATTAPPIPATRTRKPRAVRR